MNHDEARGLLDDLLDDALSEQEAADVRAHIEACDQCRSEARSIKILSLALAKLANEELRSDERSLLVDAARARASRRRVQNVPVMAWLGAAAVLVVVLAVGVPMLLAKPEKPASPAGNNAVQSEGATADEAGAAPAFGSGPLPVVITQGRSYSDTGAIDAAVRADPGAVSFLGFYRASDVGALQRQFQEYVMERAPVSEGRSPAECMNLVFRSVSRPTLPAYVERARFEGQDAWVLAFAFADDAAPDTRLSELLIYVFARSDCSFLSTALYR